MDQAQHAHTSAKQARCPSLPTHKPSQNRHTTGPGANWYQTTCKQSSTQAKISPTLTFKNQVRPLYKTKHKLTGIMQQRSARIITQGANICTSGSYSRTRKHQGKTKQQQVNLAHPITTTIGNSRKPYSMTSSLRIQEMRHRIRRAYSPRSRNREGWIAMLQQWQSCILQINRIITLDFLKVFLIRNKRCNKFTTSDQIPKSRQPWAMALVKIKCFTVNQLRTSKMPMQGWPWPWTTWTRGAQSKLGHRLITNCSIILQVLQKFTLESAQAKSTCKTLTLETWENQGLTRKAITTEWNPGPTNFANKFHNTSTTTQKTTNTAITSANTIGTRNPKPPRNRTQRTPSARW